MKLAPLPALLALSLLSAAAVAADATAQYRVTGLFQPDRVDDLRRQAAEMPDAKLESVDYETTVATFRYDADAKPFRNARPEQVQKQIDEALRRVSRGAFTLRPLSEFPRDQWQEVRVGIVGLDCKACAFYAYNAVCEINGVERATASFKDGWLTAWIDPARTSRDALAAALKKRDVKLADPQPSTPKPTN